MNNEALAATTGRGTQVDPLETGQVTAATRSRTRRLAILLGLVTVLAAFVTTLTAPPAAAATVNVRSNTCSDLYNIVPNAAYGQGVNFAYGSHATTKVKLNTRAAWGWKQASRGQAAPVRINAAYDVRFLDGSGRVVWSQSNALPNGGSRTFQVGSNVRTIQVRSRIETTRVVTGPGVGYDSSIR
ncbi:MAG: hypothetical protein QM662_14355 [Gordonia sp. (in: high G+C Gram-positive bacteria)]